MKKTACLLLLIGLIFSACDKEELLEPQIEAISESTLKAKKNKVTICHYDADNNTWHSITVSANALKAHKKHGDVIIDEDGDGFAVYNECGILNENGIDCDDTDPSIFPGAGCIARTYVPDDNFEQELITLGYDDVLDDYVLTDNIAGVTALNLNIKNISDMTGIEDFIALKYFYCSLNALSSLDLSNNTALVELYCNNNVLSSLDVSNNTALVTLNCQVNLLSGLVVSNNTALENLNCSNNGLGSLDVSDNAALKSLVCINNGLSSLDVSFNTALTSLSCSTNSLSSLNVSNNTALTYLACGNNGLSSLDVSNNIALAYLFCEQNGLSNLDVSNNPALFQLRCFNNNLSSLDVSNNTALGHLRCYFNSLSSLDVSNNLVLTLLYCYNNQLTVLNLKNGNNAAILNMNALSNPNLTCIQVDDAFAAAGYATWLEDVGASYSVNCGY